MKKIFLALAIAIAVFASEVPAQADGYFRVVAGRWQGTLEYKDYTTNERVTMKVLITIEAAPDGRSATVKTIYDDFGKIYRDTANESIEVSTNKFKDDDTEFTIEAAQPGKLVLTGQTKDGDTVEPTRKTLTFTNDSLTILKETRQPWSFRHVYTLTRAAEVSPPATPTPQQMIEDTAVLSKALTALHPGLYRYISPSALEGEFATLRSKLETPMTEDGYFLLVAQLLNKLDCGHTFANPYNQDGKVKTRHFGGRTFLPFYFSIVDGRIIITANASSKKIAAGSEITRINGIAAGDVIAKLLTVTKADGTNATAHRIGSIALAQGDAEKYALFDQYFPLFFPIKDDVFDIEAIDFSSKKATKFSVLAMTQAERTAEMAKRYVPTPSYDDGWKFEIRENSIGYMQIGNFLTWRLKTVKYKKFLTDAFAELRAKNIKNLVIDVRGNGGGDTDPGYEIARYLAPEKLGPYAESRRLIRNVKPQPDLAGYINTYDDGLMSAVKNGVPQSRYTAFDADYFVTSGGESYPAVVPHADRFTGKTYVLADALNASATFQFLDYLQTNRLATIVGQTSGGNKQGINGGNYLFLRLPNSRIEVDIPVYFQSALTRRRDEGVLPDVAVKRLPEDIGNGVDREMDVVIGLIRKASAAGRAH